VNEYKKLLLTKRKKKRYKNMNWLTSLKKILLFISLNLL